jgi:hypothetical protein
MSRIIERRGDQVYREVEDWDGSIKYEWQYDPAPKCACGKQSYCEEVKQTTFSEQYACGYVYRYTNRNGLDDNLIAVNGKRVK